MTIKYTWKVTGMKTSDVNGVKNAIVQTFWQKIGTDSDTGETGTFNGATPFKTSDIDPKNFVPFEKLTEAIVVGWIQSVVTGPYENHVNEVIQREISQKTVKTVDAVMPWAPVEK